MRRKRASMSVSDFIKVYKWHVVIWIIGLIVLGNFVYKKVTAPTYLLNGIYLGRKTARMLPLLLQQTLQNLLDTEILFMQ